MEPTNILIKILPPLIVGACNNLFDRSIEKLVMDKADFESIIEDRILFDELPDIDTRIIRSFLELDNVELIVKQIYVDNVDKSLGEIKENFCLLFSHHFNVKTEPSYEFASNLFDVLVEGCHITFDKAISKGSLSAHDAKTQYRFRQLSDDLGRIDRNTQDTADIVRKIENVLPLLAPEHPIKKFYLGRLPSTSSVLFGREKELEFLDAAWEDSSTNIVSLVAWGGVGKTSLVNKWLRNMKADSFRGAERVFGWSFYSQGASEDKQVSADVFIASALKWFGDPEPDEGSPWEKAERLADFIKKQKTLLILDGVEPLQNPPGEGGGRIKDPGFQYLLRELANHNLGLCIITTRLEVDDIKDFIEDSVQSIPLDHLSPDEGMELLKHFDVKGTDEELKQASRDFGNHALALTLLGSYLAVAYDGDVRKRDRIESLTDEEENGGHAKRVMESYEKWLKNKPELNILYIMGVFGRPAEVSAIKAFMNKPVINGLTSDFKKLSFKNLKYALNHLSKLGLLSNEGGKLDKVDCHPLMREYFSDKVKNIYPDAWKEANSRLYEYYKNQTEEYPETIEGMVPLYQAVAHGCEADLYQEALDEVYWRRILRGNEHFNFKKLGAFGSDLAALSGFFDLPWSQPVNELSEVDQPLIQSITGSVLQALGRLAEAVEPMQVSLKTYIIAKDLEKAAIVASNLSEVYLTLGKVPYAIDYAKQGVDLADRRGDIFMRMGFRTTLADALHQGGHLKEAENIFIEAEGMQIERNSKQSFLDSIGGFRYCDLLLNQGECRDVLGRAEQTLEWGEVGEKYSILSIPNDKISLGRAHMLQNQQEGSNDFAQAEAYLEQAIEGLRLAGRQQYLPNGLLARAELHRVRREFPKAQRDLDEVMRIAERGGMGLHKADCHLEYARLYLAMGEKEEDARNNLETAKEMIEEMGYHRRDVDVVEIEEKLL